jgi:hypothetical protein
MLPVSLNVTTVVVASGALTLIVSVPLIGPSV